MNIVLSFIVDGCLVELKAIDDDKTLACSNPPPFTSLTWLFNNETLIDAGPEGRTVIIPSGNVTVYGNYGCLENSSLEICFNVYIAGWW